MRLAELAKEISMTEDGESISWPYNVTTAEKRLTEALLRIEQLEAALAALCGAVSDFLRTDVDDPAHGYIEKMKKEVGKVRAALEGKDG